MSFEKNWGLQIDPTIYKFLKKIPRPDAERIFVAIESLPNDPFSGDIQKMKGEKSVWRRRIGAFRIFYELIYTEKIIHITGVKRRGSKTY